MMKTLLLFRHGKSDWEASYGHDHDRPLAKRGKLAADKMGRFLAEVAQVPDSIITSSAVRARDTVRRAGKAGDWPDGVIRVSEEFYGATLEDVLREVRREPDTTDRLMLVGHEPTWSGVTSALIGGGKIHFPTAAMACISLDVEHWQDVSVRLGALQWLVVPRFLP